VETPLPLSVFEHRGRFFYFKNPNAWDFRADIGNPISDFTEFAVQIGTDIPVDVL